MEEPIYIVKGAKRSALINLNTSELRILSNERLSLLDENIGLQEEISDFIFKHNNVCEKELLDIRIEEGSINYELDDLVDEKRTYQNIRIICQSINEVLPNYIEELITQINNNFFHFGIVIFIPESYDKSFFVNRFKSHKVLTFKSSDAGDNIHNPIFHCTPNAIYISKENNLFHFSRDTLFLNGNKTRFVNHDMFNIPKNKIKGCKNCEFRLTCYDDREVNESNGEYFYDSICKYES